MKLHKQKLRYSIIVFLCLFLITGFVVTYLFVNEIAQEEISYLADLDRESQNTLFFFSQSLLSSVNSCNSIFQTTWYQHYRNNAGIYNSDFDPVERMEIQTDLAAKVTALTYVSDVLVITPPPLDSVICRNGWFSTDFYHKVHANVKITFTDDQLDVARVVSLDDANVIMILNDPTPRRIKGVICILIDKKAIAAAMKQVTNRHAIYCRLDIFDQVLYEQGQPDDLLITTSSAISWPPFSVTLSAPRYQDSLMKARIVNYALIMVIVLLVSIPLSVLITSVFHKPIRQLVKGMGGNFQTTPDPYHFIADHMEAYARKYAMLNDEQARMDRSIQQFLRIMRNEMLNGMLTNPDFDFDNHYVSEAFPWFKDKLPFIMVLLSPISGLSINAPDELPLDLSAVPAAHAIQFAVLASDRCQLFWFRTHSLASVQKQNIEACLTETLAETYCIAVSEVISDPAGLYRHYIELKTGITMKKQVASQLPIALQIELFNRLNINRPDECQAFIRQLRVSLDPDMIMPFFLRIASDYEVSARQIEQLHEQYQANQYTDEKWTYIEDYAHRLCYLIDGIRHESTHNMGKLISNYIDENFTDPNLCMKQLADKFGMHRTQISRILKARLGVTFSDYLLELRIRKAVALMHETEYNFAKIAETVGYINYITFKNAFFRVHNMSPREFRQAH